MRGPAVGQIWQTFQQRWNDPRPANHNVLLAQFRKGSSLWGPPPECPTAGTQAVQVNLTLPPGVFPVSGGAGEMTVARAHERAIDQAQHYIYVEDQYVWPCSLVDKLVNALARGVHVLLLVARDYDAPGLASIAKGLRHQVVTRLREAGGSRFQIRHIEREDGQQVYVHSKVLIVDDCYASVGSANFNARSLTNDTELQIGIVDQDLVETPFDGKAAVVCRFAHELRCALWAEHLEVSTDAVRDPMAALATLWSNVPIAPSRRAHKHDTSLSVFSVEPVTEYLTTLITERMAHIPHVPLPQGISDRSAVRLTVNAMLRGPQGALMLKVVEELLNPDLAPAVAGMERAVLAAVAPQLLPKDADAKLERFPRRLGQGVSRDPASASRRIIAGSRFT
ncbi:MAG: phospholipase D-like domain-containing protein [Hyphomicrobium sp.]